MNYLIYISVGNVIDHEANENVEDIADVDDVEDIEDVIEDISTHQ